MEATAGGQIIARPHFAQVMLKHAYVSSIREAFDLYLDTDEYQKIERFKADAGTCIKAIHKAGGKAVFAHPYQLKLHDAALEKLTAKLKSLGLDGIECHYPKHTPEQTQYYLGLAEKYRLHVTAGSDFHGENVKPDIALMPTGLELSWLQ